MLPPVFVRYTTNARRVLFFGRYEASQFGSPIIESEHLLLGLIREDRMASTLYLSLEAGEVIRTEVEHRTTIHEKKTTSIDIPLSPECKSILRYAAEEAQSLKHRHVDLGHLYLGMLREDSCLAATLLREQDIQTETLRTQIQQKG